MRVLIVGAGIAGLTAALQLRRTGHEVVIMERQAAIPSEGYMVDFFGPGYDVAERLGLLDALAQIHHQIGHLLMVDSTGSPGADLAYPGLRKQLFRNRHLNFLRGDLARVLRERLSADVPIRFGTWPIALDPEGDRITVKANIGAPMSCDLLVGADGTRSGIRALAFLAGDTSVTRLGCHTAAYIVRRPLSALPADAFVSMSDAGLTAAAYPIRGGRTAAFFLYRADREPRDRSPEACRRELASVYRGKGWILDELLDAFPDDGEIYFDDVVQIEASRWSEGRTVLVGDAAWCVSPLAGQGASLAMYGAYALAQELARHPDDVGHALRRYEARVRPVVAKGQRAGRRARSWFLPKTRWRLRARDRLTNLVVRTPAARLIGALMGGSGAPLD